MTHLLALVFAAVQCFVACIIAHELLASTLNFPLFLLAEALNLDIDIALVAFALMTLIGTLMTLAVECAGAQLATAELAPGCERAGHALGLLGAEALHGHGHVARGTAARVAQHVALPVHAVLVLTTLAVLTARVRQLQGAVLWLIELTTETIVLRHCVFSVAIIAIGARPAVKSDDLLGNLHRLRRLLALFLPSASLQLLR